MTDEQLALLNERLDRMEASLAKVAEMLERREHQSRRDEAGSEYGWEHLSSEQVEALCAEIAVESTARLAEHSATGTQAEINRLSPRGTPENRRIPGVVHETEEDRKYEEARRRLILSDTIRDANRA